jgi:hypothetical protein
VCVLAACGGDDGGSSGTKDAAPIDSPTQMNCAETACHGDGDCGGATTKCCPKLFTPSYGVCKAAC